MPRRRPYLKVKGINRLETAMGGLADQARPDGQIGRALWLIIQQAQRYAIGITHVLTGRLKSGHHAIEPTGNERQQVGYVANNVNHAPYEHRRGGSHAFYRRMVDEEGPNLRRQFGYYIERISPDGQ